MTQQEMEKIIKEEIKVKSELCCDISDKIWEYAELSLKEYKSADLYIDVLKKEGFQLKEKLCGIDTCFKASYGSGRPYIGILGEFDALSGLSQAAGKSKKKELVKNGSGHGCGHNMLGAGSLLAAFCVKKLLSESKLNGTVIFYGCPGEEGGASKAFLARDEEWKMLDAALSWHPDDLNRVSTGTCNSCIQKEYEFSGIAAHAAGNPEAGRSALDAVSLMNLGVEFLREHMNSTARVHYAITNSGGISPNVVQAKAKVLYMIRDVKVSDAVALEKRVDKIAKAAAMMTETKLKINFIDGCANVVPNKKLEELLYNKFISAGVAEFNEEEKKFAAEIVKSYEAPSGKLPGGYGEETEQYAVIKEKSDNGASSLNDFLVPYSFSTEASAGSTDVGDVSWQTPTAQINTVCFASNSPGHSWQNVSVGKTSIGHKGLENAGLVLALACGELFINKKILYEAKEEFEKRTENGYICPVPKDAKPIAI